MESGEFQIQGNINAGHGWGFLVQQHDETARYGCESAPNYTGKKKGATPQFHVVALLVQQHDETARYGCESAPNYTGKKKGATPQFHFVALLEFGILCRDS
jgi:hypothetical protein